jgi:TfoX/Sxy family transcriptional regulator of competence genes
MKMPKADAGVVGIFEELTPLASGVSTRKMFGQPAAFANGNLFFGVFGKDLFVRLSESDRSEAKTAGGFVPFEPMPGRAMSEYWVLPASVLRNKTQARQWVGRSLDYASKLPAKKSKAKPK